MLHWLLRPSFTQQCLKCVKEACLLSSPALIVQHRFQTLPSCLSSYRLPVLDFFRLLQWPQGKLPVCCLFYVSGVSVCIFVALYLCMFGCLLQEPVRLKVLWVDAQEPMRSWHLFKHGVAKGRTRALWDRHLDSSSSFITATGVWKNYIKYLHDSNTVYSGAAV